MKKSSLLALFLALVFGAPALLRAQMRPRRAADEPARTQPSKAPTPLPKSAGGAARRETRQEQTAEEVGEDEVVRINATLVTIPVSVLDRDGRFISGLRKEDFRIFEDGGEQQVAYFATTEEPFTVALILDTSASTRFKLEDIQDAAIAFLDQLRPEDKVIVVSFDEHVRVLSEATNDRRRLRDAIRRTSTGGNTRLYDAVDLAIQKELSRARGRKAIVLFTDGVDTASRNASFESTLAEAEELDALIYPIQYDTYDGGYGGGGNGGGTWPGHKGSVLGKIADVITGGVVIGGGGGGGGGGAGTSRGDYRRGADYLRRLAEATGGRHHNANDLRYLGDAFTNIAEELRRQYSLGYYPSRQSQASERRQIRVRVKRPNLVVRARDSYIYKPSAGSPADNTAQQPPSQSAPVLRKNDLAGGTQE